MSAPAPTCRSSSAAWPAPGRAGSRRPMSPCRRGSTPFVGGAVRGPGRGARHPHRARPRQRDADAPDVMRGEETQLAGARPCSAGTRISSACPAPIRNGSTSRMARVAGFRTWMTGELFAVLSSTSILRHSLGEQPRAVAGGNPRLRGGCAPRLATAATVGRACSASGPPRCCRICSPADARGWLSGLLIGARNRLGAASLTARRQPVVARRVGRAGAALRGRR